MKEIETMQSKSLNFNSNKFGSGTHDSLNKSVCYDLALHISMLILHSIEIKKSL